MEGGRFGELDIDLPASKRLRLSSGEGTSSKDVIKKYELLRIINGALYSLGYKNTGMCLEKEPGIEFQSERVNSFVNQITDGEWDESLKTLRGIGLMNRDTEDWISLQVLHFKYDELVKGGKTMEALRTLRTEVAPLSCACNKLVRDLSVNILSPNQESQLLSRESFLENLQNKFSSSVMFPRKRLTNHLEKFLDWQRDACKFHNSTSVGLSLLTDHQCGREQIPSQTVQILEKHSDQVWFLQFSHNGKYLASSSRDGNVIIWEVQKTNVLERHILSDHQAPVSYISWSPNDLQILTCGVEKTVKRWDIQSGECLHTYAKQNLGMVSCGWALDGNHIFTSITDGSIIMWNLEGVEVKCWTGLKTVKVSDMGISSNRQEFITICKEDTVLFSQMESDSKKFIREYKPIVSFSLSEDRKFLLLSLLNEELRLWNIDGTFKPVGKYIGHKCSRFVVRSCFGGLKQEFIASGSEDSQVYIWHRASTKLICKLAGHIGVVNCVSWNPADPRMLASAGDDHTIRIWGNSDSAACYEANRDLMVS